MFQEHTSIFVTFHPVDRRAALKAISEIKAANPQRAFHGRHQIQDNAVAAATIALTTLTVILETAQSCESSEVCHDVGVSLSKIPPNQILRILLPGNTKMAADARLSKNLAAQGVEMVPFDQPTITDALMRLDFLGRYELKLRQAVVSRAMVSGGCNR